MSSIWDSVELSLPANSPVIKDWYKDVLVCEARSINGKAWFEYSGCAFDTLAALISINILRNDKTLIMDFSL